MKRAFQIDFLRARGLRPDQRVLDIGCGSLRGGIALIQYLDAGGYTGVDVRAEVLQEAQRELVREGLGWKRPTVLLARDGVERLRFPHAFDVMWAFSVLFHLSDQILDAWLEVAQRELEPGGVLYANVILGAGAPGRWQGFPVVARSLATYRQAAARHGLAVEVIGVLQELGHVSGDPSQDGQTMLALRRAPAETVPAELDNGPH